MKKLLNALLISTILAIVFPMTIHSADIGIGARIGDPTGISVKRWTQPSQSMNFAAAWDLGTNSSLVLLSDYTFYNYDLLNIQIDEGTLPLHYGFGAQIRLAEEGEVGIRVPVGLTFKFSHHPADFFFELAPTLNVFPETSVGVHGSIGAHYYF